jgi:RNA polymerase sigma factor (sigma-70 family)
MINTMTISDEIIIQQALRGEQQGFANLVKKYEQLVFTLALRVVKNQEDAHEVAQDAFLRAFRYLNTFRGDCKFSTWMYQIVYSTGLNHLRKKRPDILSMDDAENAMPFLSDKSSSVSEKMEQNEQKLMIQAAINQLSPDDATIITLFYLFEQKISEICIAMNINESNAKTKLSRARQRLRVIVEENFLELK